MTIPPLPIAVVTVLADDEDPALFHVLPSPALARDTDGGLGLRLLLVGGDGVESAAFVDAPVELRHDLDAARPAVEAWAATNRPGTRVELRPARPAEVHVRLAGPGLTAPLEAVGAAVGGAVELAAARLWAAEPGLLDVTVEGALPTRIVGVRAEVSVDVSRAWSLLRAASPGGRPTEDVRRAVWTSEAITVRVDGLPAAPPALVDVIEGRLEALLEGVLWRDGVLVDDAPVGRRSFVLEAGVVAPWPWRARARLSALAAPGELAAAVTRVVLTDPAARVEVGVRVALPGPDASAEVELRAGDAHAELVVTDTRTYRWRLPPGAAAGAPLAWEWRARLRSAGGAGEWTAWTVTDRPFADIVLARPDTGRLQVATPTSAAGRAEVELRVGGRAVERVVLDERRRSAEVARLAGASVAVVWWDAEGRAWPVPPEPVDGTLLVLSPPWDVERMRLLLWPSGDGWGDVARAFVDVRHTEPAGLEGDELVTRRTVELTAAGFVAVELPVRPGAARRWEARLHVSRKDGGFRRGAWVVVDGDTWEARVDAPARRTVEVFPTLVDWARVSRVEVALEADGAPPGRLVLTGRERQVWSFEGRSDAPVRWTARWALASGETRETAGTLGAGPLVLVDGGA